MNILRKLSELRRQFWVTQGEHRAAIAAEVSEQRRRDAESCKNRVETAITLEQARWRGAFGKALQQLASLKVAQGRRVWKFEFELDAAALETEAGADAAAHSLARDIAADMLARRNRERATARANAAKQEVKAK